MTGELSVSAIRAEISRHRPSHRMPVCPPRPAVGLLSAACLSVRTVWPLWASRMRFASARRRSAAGSDMRGRPPCGLGGSGSNGGELLP
jgi:hypothetical protein